MKLVLAKWAADRVQSGSLPEWVATEAMNYLKQRLNGHGGIILLDAQGRLGIAHNTPRMAWALRIRTKTRSRNSAKPLRVWRGRPRPRKAGFYVTARRDSCLPRPRRISKEIKKDSPEPPKAVPNKPSRLEGQLSPRYRREIAGILQFRETPMNSIRIEKRGNEEPMARKTEQSRKLQKRAEQLIPGGVNSPVRAFRSVGCDPLYIVRGQGSHIWDADGNEYVDYIGSWGPLILGHAAPTVIEAVIAAARNGTSFGASTPAEADLAELVISAFPHMQKVRFVSSGTEATMSAIRLARAYTKRKYIVKFEGCYHGHADALLVKAGSGVATLGIPGSAGVPEEFTQFTLALPYNDTNAIEQAFEKFKHQIACVIVEPVVGNMGCVPPASGYLEALRAITKRDKALLIFDEVMTGFRLAYGGAQELYGDPARSNHHGQNHRRRLARRRLRRPKRNHGSDRSARPGVSSRNALRQSAGDGRWLCHAKLLARSQRCLRRSSTS